MSWAGGRLFRFRNIPIKVFKPVVVFDCSFGLLYVSNWPEITGSVRQTPTTTIKDINIWIWFIFRIRSLFFLLTFSRRSYRFEVFEGTNDKHLILIYIFFFLFGLCSACAREKEDENKCLKTLSHNFIQIEILLVGLGGKDCCLGLYFRWGKKTKTN